LTAIIADICVWQALSTDAPSQDITPLYRLLLYTCYMTELPTSPVLSELPDIVPIFEHTL
jgi:hypothetical protein